MLCKLLIKKKRGNYKVMATELYISALSFQCNHYYPRTRDGTACSQSQESAKCIPIAFIEYEIVYLLK